MAPILNLDGCNTCRTYLDSFALFWTYLDSFGLELTWTYLNFNLDLLELTWTYLNLFGLVSDPEGCHYMSDLDSSLLLSSSGCSSREAVLLQHPPIDQVGHGDHDDHNDDDDDDDYDDHFDYDDDDDYKK